MTGICHVCGESTEVRPTDDTENWICAECYHDQDL